MLRTSRPCAVTTSGASTEAAISPDGTRKCAHTTSGRAADRTCRRSSRKRRLPAARAGRGRRARSRGPAPGARARAGGRRRRGRGRPAPDTSARRAGSAPAGLEGHDRVAEPHDPRLDHAAVAGTEALAVGAAAALGGDQPERLEVGNAGDERSPRSRRRPGRHRRTPAAGSSSAETTTGQAVPGLRRRRPSPSTKGGLPVTPSRPSGTSSGG